VLPRPPAFLGELREGDRRGVLLDPPSQVGDAGILGQIDLPLEIKGCPGEKGRPGGQLIVSKALFDPDCPMSSVMVSIVM
jgi:hypothetical protein